MNLWELERHLRKWKKFTKSLSYHIHWIREVLPETSERWEQTLGVLIKQLNDKMELVCKEYPNIQTD